MERNTLTRRSFLKLSAIAAAGMALSPKIFNLKGLAKTTGYLAVTAGETKVVKSGCFNCKAQCQVLLHVRDGRLIKVEGDPDGIFNEGTLCPKSLSTIQYTYSPLRLQYPMKRTNPRDAEDPGWVRISWDEALDLVANKLNETREKYGAHSVAFASGTGRGEPKDAEGWFGESFGTPSRISAGDLCWVVPRAKSYAVHYGISPHSRSINPDPENAKNIFAWANLFHSGRFPPRVAVNAIARGCKIVCPDPRYSITAQKADLWIPLRPSTDGALAMGMYYVMLEEDLWDKDFVTKWTNALFLVRRDNGALLEQGDVYEVEEDAPVKFLVWDTVSKSTGVVDTEGVVPALYGTYTVSGPKGSYECDTVWQLFTDRIKEYPPERAAEICWIDADMVRQAARIYCDGPTGQWMQVPMDQHTNAWTASRLVVNLLPAITGMYDIPGGSVDETGVPTQAPRWEIDPEVNKHRPGYEEYPIATRDFMAQTVGALGWEKALKGEYKALIGWSGLPYSSQPDTFKVHRAIQNIPWIAVVDIVMTPLGEQADVVLPATWWTERNYWRGCGTSLIARQKAHDPPGDQRNDIWIALQLGKRTDPDKWAQWETEEDFLDWMLEPTGLTFKEFAEKGILTTDMVYKKYEKGMMRRDGQPGFSSKTRKVEIYSTEMYRYGYDPIPYWYEPFESPVSDPEMAKEYPLLMLTGHRHIEYLHSEGRQVPWLRERVPESLLEINPQTAAELGIVDGDMVYAETPTGKVHIKAKLWNGIHPKMVAMCNGWYFPDWRTAESNVIVNADKRDPVSGAPSMRGFLCKVYK